MARRTALITGITGQYGSCRRHDGDLTDRPRIVRPTQVEPDAIHDLPARSHAAVPVHATERLPEPPEPSRVSVRRW